MYDFESYSEAALLFVPIGAEQSKMANLPSRAHMLADTWADVVIADAYQPDGFARILGQTVDMNTLGNMVTVYKLIGYRHVLINEAVHLIFDELLFLSGGLVGELIGYLALLALDVSITTSLTPILTYHQLIEQMLGSMGRREFLLVVFVQNQFVHDIIV